MLKARLLPHIYFAYFFLVLAAAFGLLYAMQLLGFGTQLIRPDLVRSLHISLMLYGFVPLMMTLLPFALFDKEGVMKEEGVWYLERFLYLWYIFLVFLIFSLLAGDTRGLPFYDFPYELNAILALAGIFYIIAIFKTIKGYEVKPLWVRVSLVLVIASPFALLLLMNPRYGQVEKMLLGPHGDNTLGMSFALLAIYYLAIKLASPRTVFSTRRHILWQIPLGFYLLSVLYRSFIGSLSYNAEWLLQYLTLLYIPVLYIWWKDAGLKVRKNLTLFISIAAFLFADVEGNILFIPWLRALFHRNDLVVGHAHIAVGIGLLFLALSIIEPFVKVSARRALYLTGMLFLMALVLSISGIEQAGFAVMHTELMWALRVFFGLMFLAGLLFVRSLFSVKRVQGFFRSLRSIDLYNLAGFLSDGVGGILLLLFGSTLYALIDQPFVGGYQTIVFGFVTAVGLVHLLGFLLPAQAHPFALATVILRLVTAAGFFALYKAGVFEWIAYAISGIDLLFVLLYLIFLKDPYEKTHTSQPSFDCSDIRRS
ncbi:hypothetical protein [Sulfurovum riftiae]|uniref:hypothetical protein n=1 Tax=Sulfurovum riftiae TaxID=1630136 RepID=UPI000A98FD8C|nr:hypothetical protein [Sulfurovum riftiae]